MEMDSLRLIGTVGTAVLVIGGMWGVFSKAGRPGWYALIPIFNVVTLCRVCGVTGWLAVAMLIPLANLIALIYLADKLAKSFGRGIGTTLGIIFLGFAFLPLLGFGEAQYAGPGGAKSDGAPALG